MFRLEANENTPVAEHCVRFFSISHKRGLRRLHHTPPVRE
jgi:hypothetical protein